MGRLIDADLLKEKMQEGKIVIDEDVLKCDSIHSQLVYLLEKVEKFIEETIDDVPTAYDVKKVIEQTHKIFVDELEIIEKGIPEGGEYTEEAYRLLYLNTRISDAIRNGGKE